MSRAQISFEYLIITAFSIVLAIFAALVLDVINSVAAAATSKTQNYFTRMVSAIIK